MTIIFIFAIHGFMLFLQVLLLVIFFLQLRGDETLRPADFRTPPADPPLVAAPPEELGRSLVEFFAFVGSFRCRGIGISPWDKGFYMILMFFLHIGYRCFFIFFQYQIIW